MRSSVFTILVAMLTGCGVFPRTEIHIQRDPATGELVSADFVRAWNAGPVRISVETHPDGTVTYMWESTVDLGPALEAEQIRAQRMDRALSTIEGLLPMLAQRFVGATP